MTGARASLRRLGVLVVMPLIAVAGVAMLRGLTTQPTLTAPEILARSARSYDDLAASLGANTTWHEIEITHDAVDQHGRASFELPEDYRSETWAAFGSNGNLIALDARTSGADGSLYQYQVWDGTAVVATDARTDAVRRTAFGGFSARELAEQLGRVPAADASKYAQSDVRRSTFHGHPVYVVDLISQDGGIFRTYIDRRTYRPLRGEDIRPSPNGPVVAQSSDATFEVLPGNAAPSPRELKTAKTKQ